AAGGLLRNRRAMGYGAIIVSAVLFGTTSTPARILLDGGVSVIDLNVARAWIAALLLGALLLFGQRRGGPPDQVERSARARYSVAVLLGVSLMTTNVLGYYAIGHLPIGIAVVIL